MPKRILLSSNRCRRSKSQSSLRVIGSTRSNSTVIGHWLFKYGKEVRLISRNQKVFNYPQLLDAVKLLPAGRVILDGFGILGSDFPGSEIGCFEPGNVSPDCLSWPPCGSESRVGALMTVNLDSRFGLVFLTKKVKFQRVSPSIRDCVRGRLQRRYLILGHAIARRHQRGYISAKVSYFLKPPTRTIHEKSYFV